MSLEEALGLRCGNGPSQHFDFSLLGPYTEKPGKLCWIHRECAIVICAVLRYKICGINNRKSHTPFDILNWLHYFIDKETDSDYEFA